MAAIVALMWKAAEKISWTSFRFWLQTKMNIEAFATWDIIVA